MMRKVLLPMLIALGIASTSVCAKEALDTPENLSDEDKLYGLSLFWKEASYNFAYFDQVPELDFDNAYREFIPKVLATENTFEYYRELMKFSALLHDGHTNIYLPKGLSDRYVDWPAIQATEANHQAVITEIDKRLLTDIPLGSTIISVEGVDLDTYLKTNIMPYLSSSTEQALWSHSVRDMLKGSPGSQVNFAIQSPSGEQKAITLKRNSRHIKTETVALNLPASNGHLFEFRWLDNQVAYVALNSFSDRQILHDFKLAYEDIKQSEGLIIDLRFNGGGNSGIGTEILSYFTNQDLYGSTWKTRKHIAAYKAWEYKEYAQDNAWESGSMSLLKAKSDSHIVPTLVLIGRNTASAAEDFLIYADNLQHFTTIGERTYGSTGQPIFVDLPGGGSFRVCTKRDTYPDGRDFVGFGISPNILIERMPEHLKSEQDVVLNEAIQKLNGMLNTPS